MPPSDHLAHALLPLLGGPANIASATTCMTRLRLTLHAPAALRDTDVRALPGVLGLVVDGDTCQVVLGPGVVDRVADDLGRLRRADALRDAQKKRNATPTKLALRRIAQIFVPLIPALIGCGIVAGLAGLLTNLHRLPTAATALTAVASGFMSLIAVFVGHNTAKEFGGTPVLGGAVAAVTVWPGVTRLHMTPGQGGVLGALAAALLAVYVEKACRRLVPEAIGVLAVPTVTILLPGLVALYGLMWLTGEVATAVGHFADRLPAEGGAAAGLVLGGLFLPLVMLGLHQALIPVHTTLITQQGSTVLLPLLATAGAGQVGAALAVYVRVARDAAVRRTVRSALPAGLLGIGEPLIYGVSLPLGRPFVTACVGGRDRRRLPGPAGTARRRDRRHRHRALGLGPVPAAQRRGRTAARGGRLRRGARGGVRGGLRRHVPLRIPRTERRRAAPP
ncbi:PTS transporter subunit EIIC [Streptomyces thioluteus]|uniref:PTS transporter subunit EIIC n=1 Tax=Streptomyces thioluteus TaxID=66431 RepID=A0ABN3WFX6_STRTU